MQDAMKICSAEQCDRPSVCKGYCSMHYWRFLHNGSPYVVRKIARRDDRECSVAGCAGSQRTRGLCGMHYSRWLTYGETGGAERRGLAGVPVKERFDMKWERNNDSGCWEWTAGLSDNGYADFSDFGYGHIAAYNIYIGPVPEKLVLDHLCENKRCVNPWHLEPIPRALNVARGRLLQHQTELLSYLRRKREVRGK